MLSVLVGPPFAAKPPRSGSATRMPVPEPQLASSEMLMPSVRKPTTSAQFFCGVPLFAMIELISHTIGVAGELIRPTPGAG